MEGVKGVAYCMVDPAGKSYEDERERWDLREAS